MAKIILAANTDWYLYNFRLKLAEEIQARGGSVLLVSPPGRYAERIEAKGFRWSPLQITRQGVNPLQELGTFLGFMALFRRERPDLVALFTIKPVVYGTLAARATGVPAIVSFITGLGYLFVNTDLRARTLRRLALFLYRLAFRSGKVKVVFQNRSDMDLFLAKKHISEAQGIVIPGSGVDPDQYRPSAEPPGDPVILFASRMLWDKGVGDLVEAARLLRQGGFAGRILLAGAIDAGNPSAIPRELIERWQDEGLIEWIGFHHDVPELLRTIHIVVLPSYYGEGVPRILIEAAAAGKPIVATAIPGCRVVVRHGVNGLLVPPRDPAALAGALQRLLGDSVLRSKMGAQGRAFVLRHLTVDVINDQILQCFEEAHPGLWSCSANVAG
jgi:glycosyltransferase involved in cell wall biosynthesis